MICYSFIYTDISQSLYQSFRGILVQSVCFLYAKTRLLSHSNNRYSAEKQLSQLFKYILSSIAKPRIALFFSF